MLLSVMFRCGHDRVVNVPGRLVLNPESVRTIRLLLCPECQLAVTKLRKEGRYGGYLR